MCKKILFIAVLASLMSSLQSCDKEQVLVTSKLPTPEVTNELQVNFAKALSKAIKGDAEIRNFLKQESLKMFDKDSDVLYQMVKDVHVNGGKTFHERMAQYLSPNELASIEQQLPLLTIFIPTLPSGFSPKTWQTNQEVPKVAVRKLGSDRIPFYDENGTEVIIPGNHIPGFPILVIKQNERVTTESNTLDISEQKSETFYQNKQFRFTFTAPGFDGLNSNTPPFTISKRAPISPSPTSTSNRPASYYGWFPATQYGSSLSERVVKAYQIDGNNPNQIWQRDYVYYGLTPSVPRGRLRNNFKEFIRSFELTNSGITRIAGQSDDPNAPTVGSSAYSTLSHGSYGTPSYWADGNYEFLIVLLRNPKDGTSPQRNIRFNARPDDLYTISVQKGSSIGNYAYYTITSVTPNTGTGAFAVNATLNEWDLQNFGTAWNFQIFEENATVMHTDQRVVTTNYAANFAFDATLGVVQKVGLKFGASASVQNQRTVSVQYTTGSTELGEQTLYFLDPILVGGDIFTGGNGTLYGDFTTYNLDLGGTSGNGYLSVEPASVVDAENDVP